VSTTITMTAMFLAVAILSVATPATPTLGTAQAKDNKQKQAAKAQKVDLPETKLTFTAKLEGDKKYWLPAEAAVQEGETVSVTLSNTMVEAHGFAIPGVIDGVIVQPNETKIVKFVATKVGSNKFICHMHPAHIGGVINVVPKDVPFKAAAAPTTDGVQDNTEKK
jgi:FtsP/CotA-like multicopper oxidase with cupredoxin domain